VRSVGASASTARGTWDNQRRPSACAVARVAYFQGREAGRPSGSGADRVRAGGQPQDREGGRGRARSMALRGRAIDVAGRTPILVYEIRPVGNQAADSHEEPFEVDCVHRGLKLRWRRGIDCPIVAVLPVTMRPPFDPRANAVTARSISPASRAHWAQLHPKRRRHPAAAGCAGEVELFAWFSLPARECTAVTLTIAAMAVTAGPA
jgi:hypothetical protein